ncbi:MAG: hypothetical protein LBC75_12035 [Fibromonadaceae bacterium]|jgi:hypothetical protein|nr:hypothetical protein [Fibromonadaceae bacterium]
MNIFKSLALCLLAAVAAFAQQVPQDSTVSLEAAPVSSSSEIAVIPPPPPISSSSSVVETPVAAPVVVAPEGKPIFDSVRGHAYNPYGTVGAASNVTDLVTTPSDINGQKFFYVSPTDRLGYTAFPLGENGSALLGLDNSPLGNPAALILGYANSSFGIALNYSVAKIWRDSSNTNTSSRTTLAGDNIGLYFSAPLSFATFYINANWLTYASSSVRNVDGDETKRDYSDIQGNIGLTGSSGDLSYDGYLSAIRTGGSVILPNKNKLVDRNAYLGSALNFNIGYAVLQSSAARVIAGSNNYFSIRIYDKIGNLRSDYLIGFVISPNILAEVSLSDSWLAFAGATHAINLIVGDNDVNSKTSRLEIMNRNETGALAGLRYQKPNWAVEAQVSADMFNNPFGGFNGGNVLMGLGGFINF